MIVASLMGLTFLATAAFNKHARAKFMVPNVPLSIIVAKLILPTLVCLTTAILLTLIFLQLNF
jgi:hypothetical protein